jgi:hypothetical protein
VNVEAARRGVREGLLGLRHGRGRPGDGKGHAPWREVGVGPREGDDDHGQQRGQAEDRGRDAQARCARWAQALVRHGLP